MKIIKITLGVTVAGMLLLIWIIWRMIRHIFRLADETVWFFCK